MPDALFGQGHYTAPHIPVDSGGLCWTQILDWVGVTWANLGCLVQMESTGVCQNPWTPPDSAGLQQIPVDLNRCSICDYLI